MNKWEEKEEVQDIKMKKNKVYGWMNFKIDL